MLLQPLFHLTQPGDGSGPVTPSQFIFKQGRQTLDFPILMVQPAAGGQRLFQTWPSSFWFE